MSNKIEKFLNDNFGEVRCVKINDEIWFVAKDVADALKYSETNAMTKKIDDEEITKINANELSYTNSMAREFTLINMSSLHKILSSTRKISLNKKQEFYKWLTGNEYSKNISKSHKETEFINKLEESLKAINITDGVKQYDVLNYKIDYYIPSLNIAIEYDENNHSGYKYEAHEGRQKEIENELNCKFIRVTDENSDEYNLGLVLNEIIKFTLLKDKIKKYLYDNYSCFSEETKLNMTKELLHNEEFIQDIINNR